MRTGRIATWIPGGAFREEAENSALSKLFSAPGEEAFHRFRATLIRHPDHTEIPEEKTQQRQGVDHLLPDHEADRSRRQRLNQQQIDQRNMVGDQQNRAGGRDVFRAVLSQPEQSAAQQQNGQAKRQRRIQKEDQHPGNQDEFHGEYGG